MTCCFISLSWAAEENKKTHPLELDHKEVPLECVKLTDQCGICSNGDLRKPPPINRPWEDAPSLKGKLTPYQCASQGKVLHGNPFTIENCITLSDFCAICEDGSYVFIENQKKISSNLYECSTSPRHSRVR